MLFFAATAQDAVAQERNVAGNSSDAESGLIDSVAAEFAREVAPDTSFQIATDSPGRLKAVEQSVPIGDMTRLVGRKVGPPCDYVRLSGLRAPASCESPYGEGSSYWLVWFTFGGSPAAFERVYTMWTVDGTAKEGADYTAQTVTRTMKVGASSTPAAIFRINQDTIDEDQEYFYIRSEVSNRVFISDDYLVLPIMDDDDPPTVSITDDSGTEDVGDLEFDVTLGAESGKTITVEFGTTDGTAHAPVDYTTTAGTVTFAPGETGATVPVPVVNDGVAEMDETFTVTLSNPMNVTVDDGMATGTIEDTGFKPTASVTTNPAGLEDTVGNLAFEVTIDSAGTETGTVDWTTADGTATADSDYTRMQDTLTFAAGETTMTILVPVAPDTTVEPDETLTVTLSNGENLRIGNGTGTGTIGNDDFELSIVESREGPERGSLVFPVTVLGGGAGRTTVTVEYATADLTATEPADYGRELGTLTFPTGVAEQSITVDLAEDDLGETDEQFEVVLSNPMGAVMTAAKSTATILDDDQPEITVADARGPEDGGTLGFAVSLSAQSAAEVTVDYWTSEWTAKEGVDYQRAEDTLTFAAGQTSRTIEVTLVADGLQEDDEEFDLLLGRATYATVAEDADCFLLSSEADACAVGTIENDDDPPRLSIADDEAAEAAGELAFVVTATNLDDPNVTATVLVATSGTTATADVDYEEKSETLTFTSTDPVRTFTVTVLDDRIDEPNETLAVTLTDQQNAELEDAAAVGTINDDDETSSAIALTAAPQYLNEGNGAQAVVVTATLDASARTGPTTVDVSVTASGAADAVDFEPVPDFAITIAAEETSGTGTFTLTPNDNDVDETNETVSVGGTSDLPVTGTTVELADDDEPSTGIGLSANPNRVAEGGGAVQVEVTATLNGGAGTQARTVDVTVAPSGDAAAVGFEQVPDFAITIGGGETSATGTFTLTPHDNELDETDENLTLTGESDLPVTPASVVLADDDEPPTAILLSAVPDRIAEGGGSRRVEVTAEFDRGALAEATAVVVSVAETVGAGAVDFAVSETEFTITIAAEAPSGVGTFSVTPEDDVTDERDEVLAIAGAADLPVTGTSVTLVDDDEPSNRIVLSVEPAAVAEGAGATAVEVTAMLDAGARLAGTTVVVTVSGSGEPGAVEFEMVPDFEIVVAAGETSGKATFTLEPDDDQVAQNNETVALDGVADLPVAGTSLTIVDDDAASTGIVLSAVPARVSEGAGTLEVRVAAALNRAARREATVVTVSVAGSGVAGSVDFAPVTDFAITIAAGAPSGEGSFTLTPEDDAVSEADEALTVSGTSDLPVTSTGVTLVDDDEASAAVVLTAVPGRVSEGAGATRVTVTASLDRGLRGTPTTVTVAVEGRGDPAAVDFAPVPDFEIVIAAGTAAGTGTFVLDPEADAVVESDETLTISGTSDLPVTPAVVTLSDDDEASTRIVLSAVPARVSEGAGPTPVAVTATLDQGLRQTATAVTVSVAGGGDPDTVDFDPVGDFRITIPANAASGSGTFVLRPEDDRNVESDDTLAVSGVSDLPVTSASVALADDDEVSTRILLFLTVNPAQASEGGGPVEVTVAAAVDKGVRPSPTRVAVTVTASGDPLAVDFAPVPDFEIVIPANAPEGTATFTVTPEDDMIVERDEVVTVAGTSDLPVTKAVLLLLDDDEAGGILLAALPVRVTEGGGPVAVEVTASLAGSVRQHATTVTVSVSGSGDPTAVDFNPVADFAIVIAARSASGSGTFMLTPEDDREDESDESLTISGASDLPVTPTSVSIIDDDESAPPALSVADASVAEGAAELAFVVDLDAPSSEEVTVRYGSADATAEAGSDYEPVSGTLAFAPGEVSKTVRVVVLDDELDEPDETLTLGLSHPRNATLARASASGTILDDDDPPVLSIAGASGMEGDGQLDFVISLSAPSIAEVTVRYATRDGTAAAGSDYRPVDGTMTFAPGQVAMTASVAVIDDTLDEVDEETFAVALSANTGASLDRAADRATATGVIVDDDDPPEVTVDDAAGDETVGSLAFVVSLGGPSAVDVAVDYATADDTATAGRDYEARSGTLSFAPGTVARTVLVPVLNDTEDEPDETFVVTLSDPRNASLAVSSATGTIIDDDESAPPALSVADASVAEGAAELAFVVDLDAPSSEEVTVRYGSADATAEAGSDYEPVSGTLAFAPGEVSKTVRVVVLDDELDEPDETLTLGLSHPRNATLARASASGTILDDDDPPVLSIAGASGMEGDGQLDFVISLSAPSIAEVTVRYATRDGTAAAGSDYRPVDGTMTFAPGQVAMTASVAVIDDTLDEVDEETFAVALSANTGASLDRAADRATATGVIVDDDDPPEVTVDDAAGDETVGSLAFVVSLGGPSAVDVAVDYATADDTATAGRDYEARSGTLSFAPGTVARTVLVPVLNDTEDEPDETFVVTLSDPRNASLAVSSATGTIIDDDESAPPALSVADASVAEGAAELAFVVDLDAPSSEEVTVRYGSADATAEAGSDYEPVSGTLAFAPGEVSKTVRVVVLDDELDEPDETLTLGLSHPRNATLARASASGTILDDDDPPVLSIAGASGMEGDGQLDFVISLSAPSIAEVTVRYATRDGTAAAGSDYRPVDGTMTFAPGQVAMTASVAVIDDTLDEVDEETFAVALSANTGASLDRAADRATATGVIVDDDDPPEVTVDDAAGDETVGSLAFVVSLGGPSAVDVAVDYATADDTATAGRDYEARSGTLSFAPGTVARTVLVPVLNDTEDEPDETFVVTLSDPRNASLAVSSATGTIIDDDESAPPALSVADASVAEGAAELAFVVDLDAPSSEEVTVRYGSADATAEAGSDYEPVSGTLAFAPGEVSKTVRVVVLDDELDEPDETLTLGLSHPRNATLARASASGTILDDDDPPVLSIAGASGMEGDGQLDFVISLSAPSIAEVTVRYATRDGTAAAGSDYRPVDGTMTFAPGQVAMTASVAVIDDTLDEVDEETFAVALSANTGASLDRAADRATATGVIVDDDDPPEVTVDDAAGDETVGSLAFVVSLGGPSAVDVAVDYATADDTATAGRDYEARSGTLSFAPGTVARTVLVPVLNDTEDEPDETFVVTLSDPRNASLAVSSATGTIIDDDESAPPALSVADASVAEGAAELAFVVDLDAPSSEEVTVRYGSADATAEAGSDYEPVSGTLAFAPGEVSKTVRVVVLDDELDEPDETLTLGLSHPRNATLARASASGTILDDDDPPVLSIAGASGMEGDGQLDFVISLSAPSIAEVTVRYATRDGTAAAGSDYRPVDGTMTFAPGQVAMTASVAVIDDTLDEVDEETFAVALSANTGASLDRAADRATATGVIVDDDDPPEVTVDDAAGDETVGSLAFVVSLGGPSAVDVAVDYATADDTATAGRDYEARSGTLSFAPGTVARTVLVPVLNDTEDEPDETFVVTLSDPRNASLAVSSATGTIIDDDESAPPALSVADASVAEGAAELAFVVDLDAPSSEEVTVRYGSADATAEAGSDYEPVSGTLAFAPGEVSKTVRVVVLDDELDEPDETLTLGLSHPRNATLARASASGTILDDDDPPVLSIAGASGMEGDGQLDFVISLSAPSIAEVTVRYATRDGTAAAGSDYRPVDGTMTFAPGQVAMTASVAVIDDTLDEVDEETFAVALSANTGASLDRAADRATATGVIVDDDDPPEVTVDDAAGDETVGSLAFVVSLGGPSAVDVAVDYATADDTATAGRDYEARSGTLSFAPGTVTRTILVPVLDDAEDEPDETFVLALDDPRNATLADGSATGTIRDDDLSAPDLAGGFPNAALCVGGAPFELDLAGHFEGEQITFSVVSSAPGVATAVIAGTQLTVLPVAEGTAMVTVTASNPAGTSSGEVAVRVVADPAELAAVDAVLASIGRGVLSSVTASVGDRFAQRSASATPSSRAQPEAFAVVPGRPLEFSVPGPAGWNTWAPGMSTDDIGWSGGLAGPPGRPEWIPRRSLPPFSFSLDGHGRGADSDNTGWSVWARGDEHRFESGVPGTSHEGAMTSIHLGADYGTDDWLGGVSVLHGRSEADYRFDRSMDACGAGGTGEGIVDTELTSIHPYGGRHIGRGSVWATVGAGDGELSVKRCDPVQTDRADLSLRMAAAGGRHPFANRERLELSVVEDVGVVVMTTGAAAGLAGDRSVTVGRARLGLEAAGVAPPGCECSLTTYVRAFARGDWGDGATGAALELAAGLRYRNLARRLGIDAGVQALAIHSTEEAVERSANVGLSILPRADGTGLQAAVSWRREGGASWVDGLGGISPWTVRRAPGPGRGRDGIAETRIAYGIATSRGLVALFAELAVGRRAGAAGRFGLRQEFGDGHGGLLVEWVVETPAGLGETGQVIAVSALGRF